MTDSELDAMLDQWRREYGWSPITRTGSTSPMQFIADYHGKGPRITGFRPQTPLGTIADDVEAAVNSMLSLHPLGFMALKCEYMGRQDRPWEAKALQLRALGFGVTREQYEDVLESGKRVLAATLDEYSFRYANRLTNRVETCEKENV